MTEIAILVNPSHNKVYFDTAKTMYQMELSIALKSILNSDVEVFQKEIANVFYIGFKMQDDLTDKVLDAVAKMSFTLAVFKVNPDGSLLPVILPDINFVDSGISSILKYTGKTNEYFTRMMLNIGYYSLDKDMQDSNIKVLDPVAGKGTTLYEALSFGYNAYGIEIGQKVCLESYQYMKKFLENAKYKHLPKTDKVNLPKGTANRFGIDMAKSKEDMKAGNSKRFEMICCDNVLCDKVYKKNSFDLIVGDLPYGVQHGNVTNQGQKKRSPIELLSLCIPSFKNVLKRGGCLVLSWNSFTLKKSDFIALLKDEGFYVYEDEMYMNFEHRVDNSIKRDLVVAKKI